MNWEEIKNLDFEDPGGWPPLAKGIAAAAVVIFILVVAYFLKFKEEWQVLKDKEQQEITFKAEFETKQQKAANLEAYREQLADLRNLLEDLIDHCLLYTSPSPRDLSTSRMPSSA